jgi:acyl carrier protein
VKPENHEAEKEFGLKREDLLALSPGERSFALAECIQRHVSQVLQVPARQIDTNEPLGLYGLESAKGNELLVALAKSLGLSLPATTIYNYPTIAELSRYIASSLEVNVDQTAVIAPETLTPEDDSIVELLGVAERTSVSEMHEMLEERRTTNQKKT